MLWCLARSDPNSEQGKSLFRIQIETIKSFRHKTLYNFEVVRRSNTGMSLITFRRVHSKYGIAAFDEVSTVP
jgi:hypothetical protein